MKFLTAASLLTLSSSALAAIKDIQLYAQSSNNEVNDFGISSRHEGAALNYLFLAAPGVAENLKYDDETKTVYTELKAGSSTVRQPLNVGNTVLQLGGSGDGTKVDIAEDGTLSFDGSDSIGAAKTSMTHTTTPKIHMPLLKAVMVLFQSNLLLNSLVTIKNLLLLLLLLLLQNQLLLHLKLQRKLQSTATVLLPFTPLTVHYLPPSL